jgi:hypothetical protein
MTGTNRGDKAARSACASRSLRTAANTVKPPCERRSAQALPIPDEAPVISTAPLMPTLLVDSYRRTGSATFCETDGEQVSAMYRVLNPEKLKYVDVADG